MELHVQNVQYQIVLNVLLLLFAHNVVHFMISLIQQVHNVLPAQLMEFKIVRLKNVLMITQPIYQTFAPDL